MPVCEPSVGKRITTARFGVELCPIVTINTELVLSIVIEVGLTLAPVYVKFLCHCKVPDELNFKIVAVVVELLG